MPAMKRGASNPAARVNGHHLHRRQLSPAFHQADLGGQRGARRPAYNSAVSTGPSSRSSDSATSKPTDSAAP